MPSRPLRRGVDVINVTSDARVSKDFRYLSGTSLTLEAELLMRAEALWWLRP